MLSLSNLVMAVIWLIVAGVVYWLLNWAIDAAGTPEPFNRIAKVLVIVVTVIIVLAALMALFGRHLIAL